jgi:AraC-like DNA-binding protein
MGARSELSDSSTTRMQMTAASPPLPLPPPPPWADRFRSDDLDEVREVVARRDGEHSRVAHGTGPLGYEIALLTGEVASMGWARTALPTTIRGVRSNVVLHLGMPAGSRYRAGRREHVAGPSDAVFVASGWEFTRQSQTGATFGIEVDAESLIDEVAARAAGKPGEFLFATRRLEMSDADRARLLGAVANFVQATAPGALIPLTRHCETRLIATVAGLLLEQSAVIRTRPATSALIADLEDWIEAHLQEPITLGRLCAVAGVGGRALAKIFDSRRGMSPMRYVTERRLAAVHARLLKAGAKDEVTAIAIGLGFTHLGRFAIAYRNVFGESPSQTLRRGRGVRRGGPIAQP